MMFLLLKNTFQNLFNRMYQAVPSQNVRARPMIGALSKRSWLNRCRRLGQEVFVSL
jgi:hypothetical protein